jgi:hypothetical protein
MGYVDGSSMFPALMLGDEPLSNEEINLRALEPRFTNIGLLERSFGLRDLEI